MRKLLYTASAQGLLIALIGVTPAFAQGPPGGRGMMMGDASHSADMQLFHQLFEHRAEITRQVVARADGIETVTESKNPEVTRLLRTHVVSMLARVREGRPIHQRDPLFVELFKYADRIEARHEATTRGVRVIETKSSEPEDFVSLVTVKVRARGGVTHLEWTGTLDGVDARVHGVDLFVTYAYRRVDDRTLEGVVKVDGIVTSRSRETVSEDGRTLTIQTTGESAQQGVRSTTIFQRE